MYLMPQSINQSFFGSTSRNNIINITQEEPNQSINR